MTVDPRVLLVVALSLWFVAVTLFLADELGWRRAFRWAGWGTVAVLVLTLGIQA